MVKRQGHRYVFMYSTQNGEKSVVAERFTRSLKNMIFKCMAAVSNYVYFNVLDYVVDKHNNTYHRTIKMKLVDFKSDFYAEYNEGSIMKRSYV